MNIERIEGQLMGRHEACVVCMKCSNVTPISQAEDNAREENNSLSIKCERCGDELFTVGLNNDARQIQQHRIGMDCVLDLLDIILSTISNINTDDEVEEMEKMVELERDRIEDIQEELKVIHE